MSTPYFIKFVDHSPEFYALIEKRPTAFCLLAILADRARKTNLDMVNDYQVGEAFTGASDAEKYKVGRQVYRSDLLFLQKIGQISTVKVTNKGTIVKLINSSVFDISREKFSPANQPAEQPSTNQQPTTKQEDRREKETSPASTKLSDNENLQVIDSITPEDISGIAELLSISEEDVRSVHRQLRDAALNGKLTSPIKNAHKTLRRWVEKQIEWKKIHPAQTFEEIVREQTGDSKLEVF